MLRFRINWLCLLSTTEPCSEAAFGQRFVWDSALLTWDVALEASLHGAHGMPAIETELRPWDVAYLRRFRGRSTKFWLGVGPSGSYRLWLNPFVNSGHFYWFSHYSLDLRANLPFSLGAGDFRLDVAVTVLSLVSRPDPSPDPYFYSWKFTDIVADAHDNLRLSSVHHVRKLDIVGHWYLPDKSWAPMVRCSYEAYMPELRLHVLDYALGVTWR